MRIGSAKGKDGHIIMELYEQRSPPGSHIINFEIPAENTEMVIVGGGVIASESPGKLITASFPKADLSAWIVSAKDHIVPDASPIQGFAIGLRMLDFRGLTVPKEDFMSFIHVTSVTSDVTSSPIARAPFWTQCKPLGGGFQVNWAGAGSLATCSAFDTNATGFTNAGQDCWKAGSKDHGSPSPASITAYAISLEDPILDPSYGYSVEWVFRPGQNSTPLAHQSADATLPPGVVMTGGGSEVIFSGAGNYLWKLEPFFDKEQTQGFRSASKDHTIPDPAKMETRVFGGPRARRSPRSWRSPLGSGTPSGVSFPSWAARAGIRLNHRRTPPESAATASRSKPALPVPVKRRLRFQPGRRSCV